MIGRYLIAVDESPKPVSVSVLARPERLERRCRAELEVVRQAVGEFRGGFLHAIEVHRAALPVKEGPKTIVERMFADLGKDERAQQILPFRLQVDCGMQNRSVGKRIPTLAILPHILVGGGPVPGDCPGGEHESRCDQEEYTQEKCEEPRVS